MHARASFKIKDFNKDYHPSGDHACAKRMIVPRRGTMVTLRVTIKGFALACKGKALDCFPKGNNGNFSEFLSILKKKRVNLGFFQILINW